MNIKQKVTSKLNVQAAESFVDDIRGGDYYVFASKHTPFDDDTNNGTDTNPPLPSDTTNGILNVYDQMLFGKRIRPDQTINMIRRITWTQGTVYAMYDDTDADLFTKEFYVAADEGTNLNIYKCLNNNNGAPSTQKPFGTDTSPIEFPQDGYVWKYMFTIDDFNQRKFGTDDFIPVIANSEITAAATPGSIEVIVINDGGAGYRNFTIGSFPNEDAINIGGSRLKYGLSSNASDINSYYNNCLIKITSGPAAGEYRLITDYTIENGQRVITIDRQFVTVPRATDSYEIYPNVFTTDVSGTSTANCVARAIVDSNQGFKISKIEVLNTGRDFRIATADIRTANIVAVTANAVLTPIVSPQGGHGFNINNELFARFVGITGSFTGNSEPLIANNDYRTIGILKSPLFANVSILVEPTTVVGSFIAGERVFRYKPILISNSVELFANSSVVSNNTTFVDSLRTDDRVIITDGLTNVFANVLFVNSDTEIVIDKEPTFTSANCSLFLVQGETIATVTNYDVGRLTLTDAIPGGWSTSSFIVGENSFSTARVSNTQPNVFIGTRAADEFNAFNQLTTLIGSITTTARFIQDEVVYFGNGNTTPSGIIHSFQDNPGVANDILYATTVSNSVQDGVLIGATSNAYFTVRDKYPGDIIRDSGEILYLENTNPITRNPRQTENIRIILEF